MSIQDHTIRVNTISKGHVLKVISFFTRYVKKRTKPVVKLRNSLLCRFRLQIMRWIKWSQNNSVGKLVTNSVNKLNEWLVRFVGFSVTWLASFKLIVKGFLNKIDLNWVAVMEKTIFVRFDKTVFCNCWIRVYSA